MKKINLTYIRRPAKESVFSWQKTFSVFLGNGVNCSFTSEKKAKIFLAQTNRFLNDTLQELNQIYISIFTEYRNLWFVIDIEKIIEERLQNCDRLWRRIVLQRHGENSNTFIYLDFIKLSEEMKTIIEELCGQLKQQKNYARINIMATLKFRIEQVCVKFENYGKEFTQ